MSQRRKRIETILKRPTRMTFAEVEQILDDFGMQRRRSKRGSHNWFYKPGVRPISVPKEGGRWVNKVYLDEICRVLDLDSIDLDQLDAILGPEGRE